MSDFVCPECGETLIRFKSKKDNKPLFGCFEETEHKSGKSLFWEDDGEKPVFEKTKTEIEQLSDLCPECGEPIKRVKKAGKKEFFACFNHDTPLFYNKRDLPTYANKKKEDVIVEEIEEIDELDEPEFV